MKSKKLYEAIIKNFKSNGFVLSEPDVLLESDYIIERSGEKFRSSMLTFEREDGKTMCLRPDLTVASCIGFLQKKSPSKIFYSGQYSLVSPFPQNQIGLNKTTKLKLLEKHLMRQANRFNLSRIY